MRDSPGSRLSRPKDHRSGALSQSLLRCISKTLEEPNWKSQILPPVVQYQDANARLSAAYSRTTAHRTGIPITALDISPCRTKAILAGRDILKTISVTNTQCAEEFNLKEKVNRYAASHEGGGEQRHAASRYSQKVAANDVKWSNGDFETTVATAAANGQIVLYDLNRVGVEFARLHEHNRQVHRLAFNPHRGNLLLSGSQDGTVRLWDLRTLSGERNVMTCQSRSRYAGNSEGVRDVRWCPTDALEFATGTDSGIIHRWDIRKENSPLVKVNAHEKTCSSVDWHPGGKHLLSAGTDKRIKIWDFSSSDRRMKPVWQLRVPFSACNARWRPPQWYSDVQRPGSWQCTQLVVSYDRDPRIHVWDLRRPSVSFLRLGSSDAPPSDLLWHSEDLLWSVDSSGTFTQNDIKHAPRTMDTYNVNPVAAAPNGQMAFASMKKETRRLSIQEVTDGLVDLRRRGTDKTTASSNTSQATQEDTSLLSSSLKNRRNRNFNSLRSARSAESTPPSADPGGVVSDLNHSLQENHTFRLPQVLGIGQVPGLIDVDAYRFMARHYKPLPPLPDPRLGSKLHLIFPELFAHNARVAAFVGEHRTAASWKMLAFAVEGELKERAEQKSRRRMTEKKGNIEESLPHQDDKRPNDQTEPVATQDQFRRNESSSTQAASSSATPVVAPTKGQPPNIELIERLALNNSEEQGDRKAKRGTSLGKPPPKVSKFVPTTGSTDSEENQKSETSHATDISNDNDQNERGPPSGMDRRMEERREAMRSYRAPPRTVLKFDEAIRGSGEPLHDARLERRDSIESFQMFSGSTDSSDPMASNPGSFGSNLPFDPFEATSDGPGMQESSDSKSSGQAEDALVFEDESELASNKPPPLPQIPSPSKDQDNSSRQSRIPRSAMRPAETKLPIIHGDDMEPLSTPAADTSDTEHESEGFIEADYAFEKREGDDVDNYSPWSATRLILPLIDFHCESLFDACLPSYLLINLAPYFFVPIDLRRAEQIILGYHERLVSLGLYCEAADLRNQACKRYPAVAEFGLSGIAVGGPWCTNCNKPSKGSRPGFCERCNTAWDVCAVCSGLDPFSSDRPVGVDTVNAPAATNAAADDVLWGWCQMCGHGGHLGCLRAIWAIPECEGACPEAGCVCDCMPGKRRDGIQEQLEEEWKKRPASLVSKDEWNVKESGAVSRARGLVASSSSGGSGITASGGTEAGRSILQGGRGGHGGSGPMSLSAAGRSASGGKKVRIVEPETMTGSPKGRAAVAAVSQQQMGIEENVAEDPPRSSEPSSAP